MLGVDLYGKPNSFRVFRIVPILFLLVTRWTPVISKGTFSLSGFHCESYLYWCVFEPLSVLRDHFEAPCMYFASFFSEITSFYCSSFSGTQQADAQAMAAKPWKLEKKHANKNKREKLRRVYAHLDEHWLVWERDGGMSDCIVWIIWSSWCKNLYALKKRDRKEKRHLLFWQNNVAFS